MRITGQILVIIPQWLRVFIYDRGISIQYNIRVVYLHNIFAGEIPSIDFTF